MRKLLLAACLMLPGLALAATPTVTWDSSQNNPYGIYESTDLQNPTINPIKLQTSTALANGESITVGFYWFSKEKTGFNTDQETLLYYWDFNFQGTSSLQGSGRSSTQGSGSIVLTGDGSKTVFDNFEIRAPKDQYREDPASMYLILAPGTGYNVHSTDRHKEVFIQDKKAELASYVISTSAGTGTPLRPIYFKLHSTGGYEIASIDSYSFQTRNYGSADSWVEVSDNPFCTVAGRRDLCYIPQVSDVGKEVRLVVAYISYYGDSRTIESNVIGPITKNKVKFEKGEYRVNEKEGSVDVTLVLDHYRFDPTTVNISATPLTATGNNVDFSGSTYTVTFGARQTEATLTIPIVQDNTVTNDSEADSESFRLDIFPNTLPSDIDDTGLGLTYVRIQNYKLPVISLTDIDKVADERTYEGVALNSNQDVPYEEAVTVLARAKAKNGNTFDLSGSLFGKVGVSSTDRVPYASEDTLYCVWLPQQSRYYTASSRSATEPSTNWSICPSGVTILVKNTGETAQERAQQPPPDPDPPAVMTSINDCVQSGNLSLSTVEDYATNRSPADNRFNRILSALYERTTPAPLTASEANVFYQNNRGGDNEDFYKAVYDTLTCVEGL